MVPAMTEGQDNRDTWFGDRRVGRDQKTMLVRDVFSSVADKYDLMNDLMSVGIHRLKKGAMIDWLNPRAGQSILDVGGGTGDIAFRILERRPDARVTVCDLTPAMLDQGRDRAVDRGILSGVEWVAGNAEHLPFDEMQFDAYTVAFCLRNVADWDKALHEAWRVLKPGGRFLCLEFSQVAVPALAKAYDLYSFKVLPWLGQQVTGDRGSYQYLVESIRKFPNQETLAGMMAKAGFAQVSHRNLSAGIVAIHTGYKA